MKLSTYSIMSALKCFGFGAFRISDFQIRYAQPILCYTKMLIKLASSSLNFLYFLNPEFMKLKVSDVFLISSIVM